MLTIKFYVKMCLFHDLVSVKTNNLNYLLLSFMMKCVMAVFCYKPGQTSNPLDVTETNELWL